MVALQLSFDIFRLPQGELTFTGGDTEGKGGRRHNNNLKNSVGTMIPEADSGSPFLAVSCGDCLHSLPHIRLPGRLMSDHFGTLILWAQQGLILLHFTLVITFAVRVILQRLPVGASLAWLLVLALLPYLGVGLYLLFG